MLNAPAYSRAYTPSYSPSHSHTPHLDPQRIHPLLSPPPPQAQERRRLDVQRRLALAHMPRRSDWTVVSPTGHLRELVLDQRGEVSYRAAWAEAVEGDGHFSHAQDGSFVHGGLPEGGGAAWRRPPRPVWRVAWPGRAWKYVDHTSATDPTARPSSTSTASRAAASPVRASRPTSPPRPVSRSGSSSPEPIENRHPFRPGGASAEAFPRGGAGRGGSHSSGEVLKQPRLEPQQDPLEAWRRDQDRMERSAPRPPLVRAH